MSEHGQAGRRTADCEAVCESPVRIFPESGAICRKMRQRRESGERSRMNVGAKHEVQSVVLRQIKDSVK